MMISWAYNFAVIETSIDFSVSNVWCFFLIMGVLFVGIMLAHILKNTFKSLQKSLVPASVLGGIIILVFTSIYNIFSPINFFDLPIFSIVKEGDHIISGSQMLQILTYHCLGIGFVSMGLRTNKKNEKKLSFKDVFNTGLTTVSTYLIQAVIGLAVTIIAARFIPQLEPAAGVILCLGYGQGTGQALNWGSIYENDFGFIGGANFGLTIAALGFLSASIGGVLYLNYLRRKNRIAAQMQALEEEIKIEDVHAKNDVSMTGSIDKFTIQLSMVLVCYVLAYLTMLGLSKLVPSLSSTFFGFNFLFGTVFAILMKLVINFLRKKNVIKRDYINNFMMNRIGGVAFDLMIIAGIAVIDLKLIKDYWLVLLILGILGAVTTLFYIRFVCKQLYPDYRYEQFFAMYGMLTGTASTGVILLREIDPNFKTPASDNLVYQNLPAIIFGFPIMLLVPRAPYNPLLYMGITAGLLVILVVILFRSKIFTKRKPKEE